MAKEIERKFLVNTDGWMEHLGTPECSVMKITQMYLDPKHVRITCEGGTNLQVTVRNDQITVCLGLTTTQADAANLLACIAADPLCIFRIRTIEKEGNRPIAIIGIKDRGNGISRNEFEYEIPMRIAHEILPTVSAKIEKVRHTFPAGSSNLHWEVDVFSGENTNLVVAEIELPSEDTEFDIPVWLGKEVTYDYRYTNSQLVKAPFRSWSGSDKLEALSDRVIPSHGVGISAEDARLGVHNVRIQKLKEAAKQATERAVSEGKHYACLTGETIQGIVNEVSAHDSLMAELKTHLEANKFAVSVSRGRMLYSSGLLSGGQICTLTWCW